MLGSLLMMGASGGGASYSAVNIPGVTLHLDAADASTITESGGLITQWNDISGNGHHMTATGTARPTYLATTRNGLNVVTFDSVSANDAMSASGVPRATTFTMFLVFERTTDGINMHWEFGTDVPAGSQGSAFYRSGFGFEIWVRGASGAGSRNAAGWTTGALRLITISCDGTRMGIQARLDGVPQSMSGGSGGDPGSTSGTDTMYLMARTASTLFTTGHLGEFAYVAGSMSNTDRDQVETDLMSKWGI